VGLERCKMIRQRQTSISQKSRTMDLLARPEPRKRAQLSFDPPPVWKKARRLCRESQEWMALIYRRPELKRQKSVPIESSQKAQKTYGKRVAAEADARETESAAVEEARDVEDKTVRQADSILDRYCRPFEMSVGVAKKASRHEPRRTHSTAPEAEQALDEAATAETERDLVADAAGRADLGNGSLAGRGPETAVARDRVAERERDTGLTGVASGDFGPKVGVLKRKDEPSRSERAEGIGSDKSTYSFDRDGAMAESLATEAAESVELEKDVAVGRGGKGSLDVRIDESTGEGYTVVSACENTQRQR
jgi:hypothetical protein